MPSEDFFPVQIPPTGRASPGTWFGDLDQSDFEIAFFERILERRPNYVDVLRQLGELLARKGQWARSLQVEKRLIHLRPHDGIAHYNLACSLAMQGAAGQAIDALTRAIEHGYRDFSHLEVDPDLESLRHLPAYRSLVARHRLRN
jgi:tetratricopeptide (TPR) repeat protein